MQYFLSNTDVRDEDSTYDMKSPSSLLKYIQYKLREVSVENILWCINITPQMAGFSILARRNSVIFWIAHLTLLFYVNFVSNFIYPIKLSTHRNGVIKANTNLSVLIFTINIGFWFFTKRSILISTIEKVKKIDEIASQTEVLVSKHKKLLKKIKTMVLVYYFTNFVDIFLIWMPQRWDLSSAFYTEYPCPGIQVNTEVNKFVCRAIILSQDAIMSVVVINYQSLLLFLIAHTAAMFELLSEEMMALKQIRDRVDDAVNGAIDGAVENRVKEKLSSLINRHSLLLDIVQNLRDLYSLPLGVDFAANAYCMCLFFSLPLEDWISFAPVLGYCFLVFFLYCYLCQKLVDVSEVFEASVYDSGWEGYVQSDRRTVFIVLQQAQQPVMIKAGNIVPVNIYTFASAMQCIYKFVTALKF